MARKCQLSGVSRQCGHRVSHAKNRTKHVYKANVQKKRVYLASENRFLRLRLSTRMIRTIDKLGLEATLKKCGLTVQDLQ
jgi:large subunit ribosomal protein L28